MRLNQVTLPVTDMELAAAFYRKLGFLQIVDTPHYARFSCSDGDATFSLALREDAGTNNAVIYFELDDLDRSVADLLQRGIVFDQLPTDMPYLWREAVLQDPSCNQIKLYFAGENRLNPPWRVERTEAPSAEA